MLAFHDLDMSQVELAGASYFVVHASASEFDIGTLLEVTIIVLVEVRVCATQLVPCVCVCVALL